MQGSLTAGRRLPYLGAAAGFLVWLYDYDFLLNAGGPATPISNAILSATHLSHAGALVVLFWPLVLLICIGATIGLVAKAWIFRLRP